MYVARDARRYEIVSCVALRVHHRAECFIDHLATFAYPVTITAYRQQMIGMPLVS